MVTEVITRKQDWLNSKGQRQENELKSTCPNVRPKELHGFSRKSLRKIIGLLIGQCGLKSHLNIMGVAKYPMCSVGDASTQRKCFTYSLRDCEVYAAYCFEHLGHYLIEPWELQDISVKGLLNFILATGLLKD